MPRARAARTSIDILRERDTLRARVASLDAAMARLVEETEHAMRKPELSFATICRVSCLARMIREATGGVRR